MKHITMKYLAAALLLAGAQSAFAAGPAAGTAAATNITNVASVSYEIGGVPQTAPTPGTAVITVDRLINVTVAEVGGTYTSVTPGQLQQAVTFTVTNNTNDTMDFHLDAANAADPHGGTDNFDPGVYTYYADTDNSGTFNAGDLAIAGNFLDEMAPDEIRTVFVVSDIPVGQVTGDIAGVSLQATAHDGGAVGEGALTTALTSADTNTSGVDNVFGDADGDVDALYDGKHSDSDAYKVSGASITVTKTSKVISDPINGVDNGTTIFAKAIPGAVIEYCISVSNAAGGSAATSVTVGDPIPTGTTYVPDTVSGGGIYASTTCASGSGTLVDDDTTDESGDDATAPQTAAVIGNFDSGLDKVNTVVLSAAAGTTVTTIFRVTID